MKDTKSIFHNWGTERVASIPRTQWKRWYKMPEMWNWRTAPALRGAWPRASRRPAASAPAARAPAPSAGRGCAWAGTEVGHRRFITIAKIIGIATSYSSFSAVSTRNFATKYAFFQVFRDLQNYLADFLKKLQNFAKNRKFCKKKLRNIRIFAKTVLIFAKIADFLQNFAKI